MIWFNPWMIVTRSWFSEQLTPLTILLTNRNVVRKLNFKMVHFTAFLSISIHLSASVFFFIMFFHIFVVTLYLSIHLHLSSLLISRVNLRERLQCNEEKGRSYYQWSPKLSLWSSSQTNMLHSSLLKLLEIRGIQWESVSGCARHSLSCPWVNISSLCSSAEAMLSIKKI